MTEAFLAYIWQLQLFDAHHLPTVPTGEPLKVFSAGERNFQSGPDFFNARIQVGDTVWAGNVELHIRASDWLRHRHQTDVAYQNVVLHVVYEADVPIERPDGSPIPTLALEGRISPRLYGHYEQLMRSQTWIPCERIIGTVDGFTILNWLDRLLVERLETKVEPLRLLLEQTQQSWEETCYRSLARALGAKINGDPFEWLAVAVPLNVLAKHKDQLFQLEALLFGQAGLLEKDFVEEYPQALQKEYNYLRTKFNLAPLLPQIWKTSGLRPPNFPTVRIAQLAALLHQSSNLFSKFLHATTVEQYRALLEVQPSDYWQTHYVFDKLSKPRTKTLGQNAVDTILINTVVPLLFVYGRERDKPELEDKALDLLQTLEKEQNAVIEKWEEILPIEVENSGRNAGVAPLKTLLLRRKTVLAMQHRQPTGAAERRMN